MKNAIRVFLFASVLGGLFSGCNNNNVPALPAEGTYSGFYDNQQITATLTHVSDSEIQIALSNPFKETWDARWSGSDSVDLTKPSDAEKLSSTKDSPICSRPSRGTIHTSSPGRAMRFTGPKPDQTMLVLRHWV